MPIYDYVKVVLDALGLHSRSTILGRRLNVPFIRFYALAVEYCGTDYVILSGHFCWDLEMDGETFFTKIYTTVVCTHTYTCRLLLAQTRVRVYHKTVVLENALQKSVEAR